MTSSCHGCTLKRLSSLERKNLVGYECFRHYCARCGLVRSHIHERFELVPARSRGHCGAYRIPRIDEGWEGGCTLINLEKFERQKQLERLRPETIRTYTKCIRAYDAWLRGRAPTPQNLVLFFNHLMVSKKPSTIQTYKWALKVWFDFLHMEYPKFKTPTVKFPAPKFIQVEQLKRLYEVADSLLDKAMISVCYSTAMRITELTTRKMEDLDIEDFRKAKLFVHGKTDPESDSWLPLSKSAVRDLRAYLQSLGRELKPTDYIFFQGDPRVPIPVRSASDRLYAIQDKAGMKRFGWHRLRHSRATHLRDKGVPIVEIAALLRDTVETTLRYARTDPEMLRNKLDGKDVL